MKYLSVAETAKKWKISERSVRNYCALGRIDGAFLTGKTWNISEDAQKPERANHKPALPPTLLERLSEEKRAKLSGGIYHKVQIDFTYNSNHIEGSRLTHDQTRYIYETNTIGIGGGSLKNGTTDSRQEWFAVGDYKRLPNTVGDMDTAKPDEVPHKIQELLFEYNAKKKKTFDDLLDFHYKFECIHPFQDGNGRIGRLLLFKDCLKYDIVPFIIDEELKLFYYRGLKEWNNERGYLRDTCLTAQDKFKLYLDYFKVPY